jgi:phospholipid transport system transporter-binding protein
MTVESATLEDLGEGRFRVGGDLDYETVTHLLDIDDPMFARANSDITVDLSGIRRTTSVGLSLMLEWLRKAKAEQKNIRFSNVPAQMLSMAKVSQLDSILRLTPNQS